MCTYRRGALVRNVGAHAIANLLRVANNDLYARHFYEREKSFVIRFCHLTSLYKERYARHHRSMNGKEIPTLEQRLLERKDSQKPLFVCVDEATSNLSMGLQLVCLGLQS